MLPLYLETPHKKKTLLDILCLSIQGLTKYSSAERKVLFVLEKIDGLSSQASLSPQPERLTFYFTGLPVSAENVRNVPLR
jgi:hypothetical protein